MTPPVDVKCDRCGDVLETTVEEILSGDFDEQCSLCGGTKRRVWTAVAVGSGTSGKTPPR